MKITVIDLEVNKEFELIELNLAEGYAVLRNDEYGHCQQTIPNIKFTNNQIRIVDTKNSENDKEFAEWIGKKGYQIVHIYSKYVRNPAPGMRYEIYPDYETFVAEKWSTCDEIPEIMVDNDNEELDWVLANSFTTDELYNLYLTEK